MTVAGKALRTRNADFFCSLPQSISEVTASGWKKQKELTGFGLKSRKPLAKLGAESSPGPRSRFKLAQSMFPLRTFLSALAALSCQRSSLTSTHAIGRRSQAKALAPMAKTDGS